MESFNKRLKRFREAKGISVKEMSDKLEVPVSTYREWEYGRAIKGEPYLKICKILSVGLNELMYGVDLENESIGLKFNELERILYELKENLIPFF